MGITEIFLNYYQYFLRGTQTTVIVSLITVLLGTVLGCLIALLRLSRFRLCSGFAKLYITVIRGTPLLVQLYIVTISFTSFRGRRVPFWAWSWHGSCPASWPCP